VGALLLLVDARLPFALLFAAVAVVLALERPLWGVGLLVAGRLTSTGANAWFRVGQLAIDLFEPALLLTLAVLSYHLVVQRRQVLGEAPWRLPVVALLAFQVLSLGWSRDRVEGVEEVVATVVLLATTLVILAFVRTWAQVRAILLLWVATSTAVALASILGVFTTDSAFEMAQGAREGGFGQHPNWFAMNLVFIVPTAFGLGAIEPRRALRWALYAAGALVFLAQMRSGSRGGSWSLVIGIGVASLYQPAVRRLAVRSGLVLAAVVAAVMAWDLGATSLAFERAWTAGSNLLGRSVRVANWSVCWQLFQDTWGLGIGGGGYVDQLARYDAWLYDSQYRYPHGIFWGVMVHYGVVGLALGGWFVVRVASLGRELLARTKGTELHVVAWCMVATLIGYGAWSFVEFSYDDKPFWEFLGLFTALWLVACRAEPEVA